MVSIKQKKGKIGIEWLFIPIILIIDILSKFLISRKLTVGDNPIILIKDFLMFDYTINYNAAFSNNFGMDKILSAEKIRLVFIIITSIAILCFAIMLIFGRKNCLLMRLSLAMIIAGALGNLYDRIFFDGVRDFIRVDYFGKKLFNSYSFPTFNVADSFIVVGIGLFLIYIIFFYSKDTKKQIAEKKENEVA